MVPVVFLSRSHSSWGCTFVYVVATADLRVSLVLLCLIDNSKVCKRFGYCKQTRNYFYANACIQSKHMFILLTISLLFPILTPHTHKSQPGRTGVRMKKLLLVLMMWPVLAQATCIVIIRKSDRIIIGTDSRHVNLDRRGNEKSTIDDYCKIRKADSFYFGLVGFDDINQMDCARDASKEAKSVTEFCEIYTRLMKTHYKRILNIMREVNPGTYSNEYSRGLVFAQTPVFRFENGKPELKIVTFYSTGFTLNEPANIETKFDENPEFYVLGSRWFAQSNDKSFRDDFNRLFNSDDFGLIKLIIDYEKKHTQGAIGGPIYIMSLYNNKEQWYKNKKPSC